MRRERIARQALVSRAVARLLVLGLLAAPSAGLALEPHKAITQLVHDQWSVEQGLPTVSVGPMAQDAAGYLWTGTAQGLLRFDGVQFTLFDKRTMPGIRSDFIQALTIGRDGSIWVGTSGGGLGRLKDGVYTAYTTEQGLPSNLVEALKEGRDGSLWIGTRGAGLSRLRDGRFTHFGTEQGLSNLEVRALEEDARGTLWIGTTRGLHRLRDGKVETFTGHDALARAEIRALYRDREGGLWVGTAERRVYRIEGEKVRVYPLGPGSTDFVVRAILEDRDGGIWLGTTEGLYRLANGTLSNWSLSAVGSMSEVLALYEDREGSVWFGTNAGGLHRLKDGSITTWATEEGLAADPIWTVYSEPNGDVWVGTDRGLNLLRDGRRTDFPHQDAFRETKIGALLRDSRGDLWVGTRRKGLFQLSGQHLRKYTTRDGLAHDHVRAVAEDARGRLWFGTESGLSVLENGRFTTYTTRDGLSHDRVVTLHVDRRGVLWAGTYSGLSRIENGVITAFTTQPGLPSDFVMGIHEGDDGTLWLATAGGLSRFKDGRFTAYTLREGLHDDFIYSVVPDDLGNLWMSSNMGVFRVSLKELEDFAAGRISRVTSRALGRDDGMKSAECNGASSPSGWKARDGTLWFPTAHGVVRVDPSRQALPVPTPAARVETLVAGGRNIPLAHPTELPAGTRTFLLQYTGLSLWLPKQTDFRYRLEGFDRDWVYAGTRRAAQYTNLPPGSYRFVVSARNPGGRWGESDAGLELRIRPFFYQTDWFYLLCAVVGLGMAGSGYALRVHHLNRRERALEQQLRERDQYFTLLSHEMKTPLTILGLKVQRVQALPGLPEATRPYLDSVREQTLRLGRLVDSTLDIVHFSKGELSLKREAVDLEQLARRVVEEQREPLSKRGCVVLIRANGAVTGQWDRVRLGQVVTELLRNAMRFGEGKPIELAIESADGTASLSVSDQGIGIPREQQARIFERFARADPGVDYGGLGLGLWFSQHIVHAHEGSLSVESEPGAGARFTVKLPLRPRGGPGAAGSHRPGA